MEHGGRWPVRGGVTSPQCKLGSGGLHHQIMFSAQFRGARSEAPGSKKRPLESTCVWCGAVLISRVCAFRCSGCVAGVARRFWRMLPCVCGGAVSGACCSARCVDFSFAWTRGGGALLDMCPLFCVSGPLVAGSGFRAFGRPRVMCAQGASLDLGPCSVRVAQW